MLSRICALAVAASITLAHVPASAQADIPSTTVSFKKGMSSATVQGQLGGGNAAVRDYIVRAGAGQKMTVEMKTKSSSTYFNVLPPGSEEALYRGEVAAAPLWSDALPSSGDYRIRVFLNRAAERQGKASAYALTISVVN